MKVLQVILFCLVLIVLISIGSTGAYVFSLDMAPPDTTKIDSVNIEAKVRSYAPVQKKMSEQNALLDSIILKLRNDTIKKR